jgi:hypothetical protein
MKCQHDAASDADESSQYYDISERILNLASNTTQSFTFEHIADEQLN